MAKDGQRSVVSLEGEIVEIIATGAVSSLCVVLHQMIVFELAPELASTLHLGDHIAIDGSLHVDAVRPLPDDEPVPRPAAPGRRADGS